ncbi:tudor domain-containing protein 15 [Brachionichthys hirsutus]|uniref:tudor domain-containing protein 15 n=1 Tax=Brachionichthys hirsutus TaxID=412623 RepID=UPI0036046FE9
MESIQDSELQKSGPSAACAPSPVDFKLTHLDWSPDATLIHFQGQYPTVRGYDYDFLQGEIQNVPKTKAAVNLGEFCLVEDVNSAQWYRGRVQNRKDDLFEVFLIDHGNVLSVDIARMSSCSIDLFTLPPRIVRGFLANMLLLQGCPDSVMEDYFSKQIGKNVKGYIQALLPHKVLLMEIPDINKDLVTQGFGKHLDTNTFLFLVEIIIGQPPKQNVEPAPHVLIENQRRREFCPKPFGLWGYQNFLSACGPRLNGGARAQMRVTAADNPGLFYCQMASIETELLEMSRKLAAVCEYRTKECNHETAENLGLLCAVKGKDGNWYRGFVQFLPVYSQVRVFFIDYGFFESVNVDNVHRLPPGFDSAPIMALPCSVRSDQDESVKAQQLRFLKAGLLGQVLDVEIRHFDEETNLYSITVIGAGSTVVKKPETLQGVPKVTFKPDTEKLSSQVAYGNQEAVIHEAFVETLKAEELQVDSVFVGYVEHVQNPNHFWIRTQKRNDDFEEVMTEIADHFKQMKVEDDVLWNPEVGTLCCTIYEEDMHFYRAVVTATLDHGSEVFFIDFGNTEKVPQKVIKKLPEKVASKPPFAICCSLANVFPLGCVWTSTSSDLFSRAVSNKALQVHVLQMTRNKCVVDLCAVESGGKQNISDLMISAKQAGSWIKLLMNPSMQNDTDMTEKTSCQSVTSDTNGNTAQLVLCDEEEENPKDETEMAKAPPCFKVQNIKPGFEFAVCCSDINTPSDFWCQPVDGVPALEDLMNKLQEYYSTHTVPLQSEDLCCVAKSSQDGRWYRAFITEKESGHAKVILVDYGCAIQIKDDSLQAIMPEYVHLERQAFWCSLYNLIEPADSKQSDDNWSPEVCRVLKDFVCDSTCILRCQVVSQLSVKNGLCNVVDIYSTKTHQSITNLLLRQGLVREVTMSAKQLSTALPESFVFSSYDLNPGNDEQVYVTYVSSQWDIYCHLERNSDLIEELERKIPEETDKIRQAGTRAVGRKLCLAKYLDGKWYRGVAHPVQSPLHLSVLFVDYGNTHTSEKTKTLFIPRDCGDLLYTPMQALKCNLASVSKKEHYAVVKEWLNDTILNKNVRVHIVGKVKNGAFDVELFDGEININELVNKLIASLAPKPKSVLNCDVRKNKLKTTNKTTSIKCKSQDKGHSQLSTRSNIHLGSQVCSVPLKKEHTKKCVHDETQRESSNVKALNPDKTKHCPVNLQKNSERKRSRENPDPNVKSEQPQHTEESEILQLSCLPSMKVTKGFRAMCFVSHVDSINSFYLQLSEDEPAILKMCQDLNSGNFKDSLNTTPTLRINAIVLAEFEEDGALYRSVVKGYEKGSLKIGFLDYGNSAVMGKDKIYPLPKEYLLQPRLSIPCSLFDASIYENDAAFIDAVMEKPLMVDFVHQRGTHWVVQVEILDSLVDPPASLEADTKSSAESKKEGNDDIQMLPPPNPTLQLATPSSKLKVKLRLPKKHLRHKIHSKTTKCSNKAKRDRTDKMMSLPVHAKETENCQVLAVLSNGTFYIRLNRSSEMLPALQSHIANNLDKYNLVAEEDLKQGLKCLVQAEETRQWHRAVVQNVSRGKCQVLLLDYGLTEEISSCSIRQQCSNLEKVPGLAVLCKVNCLGFGQQEDDTKSWCQTLKQLIGNDVKLIFVCYSNAAKLWRVEIIINGLFLIRHMTILPQQNEDTIPPPSENQSEREELLDTSQPQEFVFAPVVLGRMYSGCAAAVTAPFDFCVALDNSLLIMNEVSIMLSNLSGEMCPLPEAHLVPGTGCLLKSDAKNKWCRAEIVQCDSKVILNLVDYGHYESIPFENHCNLKRLPMDIANLPKVIYPCSLRGVKPVGADGRWTNEAAVILERCLYQKSLQIFFRELVSNAEWKVDILTDDHHVATELVEAGLANYTDILLGLRFKEESHCNAAPDGEEEYEDEVFDWTSDSLGELEQEEGELLHRLGVSRSSQCLVM